MISKSKKELALREYANSSKSLTEVAKNHSMSFETLRRYASKKSATRRKGRLSKSHIEAVTKKNLEKMGITGTGIVLGVTARKQKSKRPSGELMNGFSRWTKREDEFIMNSMIKGTKRSEVAKELGRTEAAVSARKYMLISSGSFDQFKDARFKTYRTSGYKRNTKQKMQEVATQVRAKISPIKTGLDFTALADLVKSHGIKVSISIDASGANIKMEI
jgi:hypothetical protein